MRNSILVFAAAILTASCGSGSSNVSVGNQNPLGTVGGVVIDAASEMPLMGATVTLVDGGQSLTATTDANGIFSIAKVPAATFIVTIANTGYQSALINGVLSGSVGNFPVKDPTTTIGPVGLVKNDGSFTVKLLDQTGAPVPNITVTARPQIRWVNFQSGAPFAVGSYQVTGMSGADGTVTLTGLPDYTALGSIGGSIDSLPIDVPPTLVMGQMNVYTFLGATFTFGVNHLSPNGPGGVIDQTTIVLAGPATTLTILNSNIDYMRGMVGSTSTTAPSFSGISTVPYVPSTGPFTMEFNQSIDHATVRAQLFAEDGTSAGVSLMATGSSNELSIAPMSALTAGLRYNMALHVDADSLTGQPSIGVHELNTTIPLFIAPASGTMVKVTTGSAKSSTSTDGFMTYNVDFSFNVPVGVGFGRADAISCIAFYDLGAMGLNNGIFAAGDWPQSPPGNTTGAGTLCPPAGTPFDITAAQPLENQVPGMPVTGFSTRWRLGVDRPSHPECLSATGCTYPSPPAQVHLLFSHTTGANTVKFPDGTPVVDNPSGLSFQIP